MQYYVTSVVTIFNFVYPELVRMSAVLFSCRELGAVTVLQADSDVVCSDGGHVGMQLGLGLPAIVFYVVGIPLVTVLLLFRKREAIMYVPDFNNLSLPLIHKRAQAQRSIAQLAYGYKPQRYYWFAVKMSQKALLVCIAVFFPSKVQLQITLGSLLSFLYILLHFVFQPMDDWVFNVCEVTSLASGFALFGLGAFFFVEDADPGTPDKPNALRTFISVLILLVFAVFVVSAVWGFYQMYVRRENIQRATERLTRRMSTMDEGGWMDDRGEDDDDEKAKKKAGKEENEGD